MHGPMAIIGPNGTRPVTLRWSRLHRIVGTRTGRSRGTIGERDLQDDYRTIERANR